MRNPQLCVVQQAPHYLSRATVLSFVNDHELSKIIDNYQKLSKRYGKLVKLHKPQNAKISRTKPESINKNFAMALPRVKGQIVEYCEVDLKL